VNLEGACIDCAAPCATCSRSASNCTSCADGFELDDELNTCNQVGGEPCGANCLDCANNTYCNECDNDYYLVVSNDGEQAECVEDCPDGTSPAQDGNECIECNLPYCRTCYTNSTCSACDPGYALQNGQCTQNCSAGTYFNDLYTFPSCSQCPVSCIDCDAENTCNDCNEPFFMVASQKPALTHVEF
jgi:hypothetical protein